MSRLSKPATEHLQRSLVTLVLILGGIPIALPLVWLVLSSLKTADRVLTERPEWLPWAESHHVTDAGRKWSVRVLDRGSTAAPGAGRDGLGWRRVRPVGDGDEPHFYWPGDELERAERTSYVASIGGVRRAVSAPEPADSDAVGLVRVYQLGTECTVAVRPGEVRAESVSEQVLLVLDQELPIDVTPADPPEVPGDRLLRIKEPGAPFYVAEARIRYGGYSGMSGPGLALASLDGLELPIEILERYAPAGVCRVRFISGAAVPADARDLPIEPRTRTRYWLQREGRGVEVRPTRYDDTDGSPREVAVLGELREWLVPAADVTVVTKQEFRITWLGQALTVALRTDVAAPAGQVALQTVSPADTAVVASDRVTCTRTLAPQWANYVRVFGAEPLHKYVLNTLFITALCILGNVLSCGLVGYAFARLSFRGRDALFLVVLATLMLPATITFLPTYVLYVKIGWLDTYYPLIVPSFLATSAFFVFLYRQFFMTIPLDLEDAARIDGCGPLGTFWHIMLPMARPAVVTVTVFTFMGTWNDFMGPLLYLNTDEYQTLAYGLFSFKTSFGYKFPHYMMAASTLMMVPMLFVFFAAQKAFLRGVVVTGVKG